MSTLFLAIPLTIFLFFVAPLWLWLHYSNRSSGAQLSTNERQKLVQLTEEARQMRERIQSLEQILDVEHTGWREQR